jgi:hypothetical protein
MQSGRLALVMTNGLKRGGGGCLVTVPTLYSMKTGFFLLAALSLGEFLVFTLGVRIFS